MKTQLLRVTVKILHAAPAPLCFHAKDHPFDQRVWCGGIRLHSLDRLENEIKHANFSQH